jgi:hypothetical protein
LSCPSLPLEKSCRCPAGYRWRGPDALPRAAFACCRSLDATSRRQRLTRKDQLVNQQRRVSAHRARDRHSLDGLAIGVAQAAITAIVLQAFLAAQLGPAIGARIGKRWRGRAEQAAGIDRILLGANLMAERPGQ